MLWELYHVPPKRHVEALIPSTVMCPYVEMGFYWMQSS